MIDKGYVVAMARYNAWQNRQLVQNVQKMDEAELMRDCGAFFGSIFGTLNHLLWGDTLWMSRWCSDVTAPQGAIAESAALTPTPGVWSAERFRLDGRIRIWAAALTNIKLRGDLTWYSGAMGREVT